jgi:thioredoxin reductase (NADPH)
VEASQPRTFKPALLSVDDDAAVARAVQRDLRRRYAERYQVLSAGSGEAALDLVRQATLRGQPVALLLADQRMPGLSGVDFLEQAIEVAPTAKRVLLTAYADTQAAIKAINDIHLDHYLLKPWDPPEENLYPVLDDLLADWQADHVLEEARVRVVGHRFSAETHLLREFLARNQIPFAWLDVERDPEAQRLLIAAGGNGTPLPVVVLPDGDALSAPDPATLASRVGLTTEVGLDHFDLVIVGAGPAGLAGAVYGASEGLSTVLVEREAPGGQAGTSSRIENYLGFPVGLSGADLTRRARDQAQRFGARTVSVQEVAASRPAGPRASSTWPAGTRSPPARSSWPRASPTAGSRWRGSTG